MPREKSKSSAKIAPRNFRQCAMDVMEGTSKRHVIVWNNSEAELSTLTEANYKLSDLMNLL